MAVVKEKKAEKQFEQMEPKVGKSISNKENYIAIIKKAEELDPLNTSLALSEFNRKTKNLKLTADLATVLLEHQKNPNTLRGYSETILRLNKENAEDFIKTHEEVLSVLKKEHGIENFGRHPWKVLKQMYEDIDKKPEKPLALLIFANFDNNGVFYRSAKVVEELSKHYEVKITEVKTDKEMEEQIKKISGKYGKADFVMITGHGQSDRIKLSDIESRDPVAGFFDIGDINVINAIASATNKNAKVFLNSCSTAEGGTQSIASAIHKTAGVEVHAPPEPARIDSIKFELNKEGIVVNVNYLKEEGEPVKEIIYKKTSNTL